MGFNSAFKGLITTYRRKSQTVRSGDLAGQGRSSFLEIPQLGNKGLTTFMDIHAAWQVG